MPGIPPDCDHLAEKLALLHLRLFPRPFSNHATEYSGIEGEETSVCRFKSVSTQWNLADRLAHARQTRVSKPEYPMLFSMFSGEFCLRLKPYLVVKIASDVLTEHYCQVCVLAMMFCRSYCQLCTGMGACVVSDCQIWLRNSSYQRTTCFGLLTLRQANMGYEKYSLHLIFTFYLNRDTSVLELFPVVVFQ